MAYLFDIENFNFKKVTTSVWRRLVRAFSLILGSFTLALIGYTVLSLFVNTDTEKRLVRENRAYEKLYGKFVEQQELIGEVTDGLQKTDNVIYDDIFHAQAPSVDPVASADLSMMTDNLSSGAAMVEKNFLSIFDNLKESGLDNTPMTSPIADLTYAQIGASLGMKFNPFYKIESQHNGLDIIAGQGEPVYATADGTVSEVVRSGKGLGNVVSIDHGNGFVTRYAHLADISVSKGQKVVKGKKIASVGISGNTFAPHLHYEILLNDVPQDPVNYMFASLSPSDYANVAYMSANTGQSLD